MRLFAPGQRAKSLEHLHGRSIIVASEFDVLQLQSLAARLAEAGGPEARGGLSESGGSRRWHSGRRNRARTGPDAARASATAAALRPSARMVDAIRQRLNLYTVTVPDSRDAGRMAARAAE